jgi:hypothetical protein
MENKLILDGVEYCLSDSLVAKLKEEIAINDAVRKRRNPFERFDHEVYYFLDECGESLQRIDVRDGVDDKVYAIANYCRDEKMMKQRALHDTLNRLLWRYSEEHGGDLPWDSTSNNRHFFIYNGVSHGIETSYVVGMKLQGVVHFKDEETAKSAIEEVVKPLLAEHPEFVW